MVDRRWNDATLCALLLATSACGGGDAGDTPRSDLAAVVRERDGASPPGHWYVAREPLTSDDDRDRAKQLESIGYASGTEEARSLVGVLHVDADRSAPGFNLYTSGDGPHAYLMDRSGEVVHRWSVDIRNVWPDDDTEFRYMRRARLLSEGRLLAVFSGRGLVMLDAESDVLWSYDEPAHHDALELVDGRIVTLDRKVQKIPLVHPERPVVDDRLVVLGPDGEVLAQVSLLDALLRSEFAERTMELVRGRVEYGLQREAQYREQNAETLAEHPELDRRIDEIGDFFHSNSVRVVGPGFAAANDGWEEGWYVISIRHVDAIVAIELDEETGVGTARKLLLGSWRRQHDAIPLESGTMLMFDNRGAVRERGRPHARAIEIDPATGEVVWEVRRIDGRALLSPVAGAVQRLPNGHTVIVESTGGTAYEVTPEGECVWKFVSPHRAGDHGELTALLTDMLRHDADFVAPLLAD